VRLLVFVEVGRPVRAGTALSSGPLRWAGSRGTTARRSNA